MEFNKLKPLEFGLGDSDEPSDFALRAEQQDFLVHRTVLCHGSEAFMNWAVSHDDETDLELGPVDMFVFKAALDFFYTGEYSFEDPADYEDTSDPADWYRNEMFNRVGLEMCFHAKMNTFAVAWKAPELMTFTEQNFARVASQQWTTPQLLLAINIAYADQPSPSLRYSILDAIRENYTLLRGPEFDECLGCNSTLRKDLVAFCLTAERVMSAFKCRDCDQRWTVDHDSPAGLHAPTTSRFCAHCGQIDTCIIPLFKVLEPQSYWCPVCMTKFYAKLCDERGFCPECGTPKGGASVWE